MNKRRLWKLCLLLLLLPLLILPAHADVGPKPSVVVTLDGLEGRECWGTLLSRQKSTGPYSAAQPDTGYDTSRMEPGEGEAWEQFLARNGEEDLYFLCYVDDCSDGQFSWTYYPPSQFKLALWFPDTQTLLVTQEEERYAFDSYFTVDLAGQSWTAGEETGRPIVSSYPFGAQLLAFLGRVALTVGLEVLAALAFGLRGRGQLKVILAANLVTQGLLNLGLNLYTYFCGALAGIAVIFMGPVYLLAELLVVAVELAVYRRLLVKEGGPSRGRVRAYTWLANLCSFLAGFAMSFQIPALF